MRLLGSQHVRKQKTCKKEINHRKQYKIILLVFTIWQSVCLYSTATVVILYCCFNNPNQYALFSIGDRHYLFSWLKKKTFREIAWLLWLFDFALWNQQYRHFKWNIFMVHTFAKFFPWYWSTWLRKSRLLLGLSASSCVLAIFSVYYCC